jgi:hypothetical protein
LRDSRSTRITVSASPEDKATPVAAERGRLLGRWLDPGRKRFWAVALLLLYTLAGFLLAPLLLRNALVDWAGEDLQREARVGKVRVNPYVLSLAIEDFELLDTDGVSLVSLDELFVNFQLSSLFRWAWTFDEIRVGKPQLLLERFAVDEEAPEEADSGAGLPRLLVHALTLDNGSLEIRDKVPDTVVETEVGPITVAIDQLNTLPDRHGQQSVHIELPDGASLGWQGGLSLGPLQSEGELVMTGMRPDMSIAYLQSVLPLEAIEARVSVRFNYVVRELPEGLEFGMDDLGITVSDLALTGLQPSTPFLSIPGIELAGGQLRYPAMEIGFQSMRIQDGSLITWLDPDGVPALSQLQAAMDSAEAAADPAEAAPRGPEWKFSLGELSVENARVEFEDRRLDTPTPIAAESLQLSLSDISNAAGQQFPMVLDGTLEGGGRFAASGSLSVLPELALAASVELSQIPLTLGQAYAEQAARIMIRSGLLDSRLDVDVSDGGLVAAGGALRLHDLEIDDAIENRPLLGWRELEVDRLDVRPGEMALEVSRIDIAEPYSRFQIRPDRTTNIAALIVEPANGEEPGRPADDPASIVLGGIAIQDGTLDFSDLSLPLPFAAGIAKLNGTISTVSTMSAEPSNVRLEGQVDEFGLARIEGSLALLDPLRWTDLELEFRNLEMSNLSPYTVEFAGRKIAQGKLDLDLGYRIENGLLQGRNDIVLSDLSLGDKVDHPEAASLPLDLAVALLKDADGVIDVDLPVEGDVNDPQFRIGGVIWQAITGLITKIVSAPFTLLGKLIGVDSEELGQFEFLAGRADLTPPEMEKIGQLAEALQQRPELTVEISGAFDPAIDRPALQYARLRDEVIGRMGQDSEEVDFTAIRLDIEIRMVLEQLFRERFPDMPLETLQASSMAPPPDDPDGKPVLDELAYTADLRDRLLASESITDEDLAMLAMRRAEAISQGFLATGLLGEDRLSIADPEPRESEDGEWVILELGVQAD